jgi:uncharacterized membrane protein YcfT
MTTLVAGSRISWVDYAKGICIILVVLMHSTYGVEKAFGTSWLHEFISWAKPFRMPDFFLISGLFLASRISRPWPEYIDSKVVHFYYFYMLWMTIQFIFKGYGIFVEHGLLGIVQQYAMGVFEPYSTLWFIHLLPIFFVLTKLVKQVPNLVVFIVAGILEALPIHTGWTVIDETAARYVYFFAGYWLSIRIFDLASEFQKLSSSALLSSLFIWGVANAWLVNNGLSEAPFISLVLGLVGAGAVVMTAVLLERATVAKALRYCGQNSIVIYLAFFIFMAPIRILLHKFWPESNAGLVALLVTSIAVAGPLLLHQFVKNTPLVFLFVRPKWLSLPTKLLRWHTQPDEQPAPTTKRPHVSKIKA